VTYARTGCALASVGLLALSCFNVTAEAQRIAATFGTRTPPVLDGQSGTVTVTAPPDLCKDEAHEIRVREFLSAEPGALLVAARLPAGPSTCEWRFEGMLADSYDVLILRRSDDRIIASSDRIELAPGGSIWLEAQRRTVDLEGRILVNGSAPTATALVVTRGIDRWRVPLDDEGHYRVAVPGAPALLCLQLERAHVETIGSPASLLGITCRNFEPGARVFDVVTELPQGLIRVVVPVVPPGSAPDWTAPYVSVGDARGGMAGGKGFRITDGFVGEYAWAPFGTYQVTVRTAPSHRVIAAAPVTVDAERPYEEVTLHISPESFGCDDGWWSACPNPPVPRQR
jgi:hypothetical protein